MHEALARLSNRIDAAQLTAIMGAIHARIPMLTADEVATMQEAEAAGEIEDWRGLKGWWEGEVKRAEERIAQAEEEIRHEREKIAVIAPMVEEAADSTVACERAIAAGDEATRRELRDFHRRRYTLLGKLLLANLYGGDRVTWSTCDDDEPAPDGARRAADRRL